MSALRMHLRDTDSITPDVSKTISFSKNCPECGAPTEPEKDYRRCVECEWDSIPPDLFEQTDTDR
jgi:hypothetical protein